MVCLLSQPFFVPRYQEAKTPASLQPSVWTIYRSRPYNVHIEDAFFEWDDDKAMDNIRNHGVTFQEGRSAFADPRGVEFYDEDHSEEEGRYARIGFSGKGQLLFVIFTIRGQRTRIISARIAERDEEKRYEQGI